MEEEINQLTQSACTRAFNPTQTMSGLIRSNSNNSDSQPQLFQQNSNNKQQQQQLVCPVLSAKKSEEQPELRQQKSITLCSQISSIFSSNNQKGDISEQSTFGFNSNLQQNYQSPQCAKFNYVTSQNNILQKELQGQFLEEMEVENQQNFQITTESTLQSKQNMCFSYQQSAQNTQNFGNDNTFEEQKVIPLVQRIQGQSNEKPDSAQQPYYTKQKKQIQPCCSNENSNNCKFTKFLNSNDQLSQLEALKYFEMNLKDQNTNDLLRLFNHKFIDILVEKSKNYKVDNKIAICSMKVIFTLTRLKSQEFIYNNKNILLEKLLALDFLSVINKFKADKMAPKTPCCLTNILDETVIKLKKYQYEQDALKPSQNSSSSCIIKQRGACFLSSFFK